MNKEDALRELMAVAEATPVIDAHTHVQDDLLDFDEALARSNLSGTQAAVNRYPQTIIAEGLKRGRMARRTMMDATHSLFYSWFAQIVEGSANRLDEALARVGSNTEPERREAGRFLLTQLWDSRYSEYAEWVRCMFRLYDGVPRDIDPVDPKHFGVVYEAVRRQRHDPDFALKVLRSHNIRSYVTSMENRDKIPSAPPVHPGQVDFTYATHPEVFNMFDFNALVWPQRATDFGLFTQGHKFQAERYLLHLEEFFETEVKSVDGLKDATRRFFFRILRSPRTNPASRCLYVDGFQAHDFRFSTPYSRATVDWAIRHHKPQLSEDLRRQVIAVVMEAMLEAMNDIGKEWKDSGERFGCCLQLCGGARHFMDWSREIQSIPEYIPNLATDEYPVWSRYPHVHFEYICAHELLYNDMAGAAKQVGNLSVGPWWHYFRRHKIARMVRDQLSMGPISSIACGFTDARFVEMIVAKYRSMRLGVAEALADMVADPYSTLHNDIPAASGVLREMLHDNPSAVHHIPSQT